jgi:integrase
MNIHTKPNIKKEPWNKGKTVGQKHPFPADALPVVRHFLKDQARDLALFNLSVDTMLRGSDLLMLKVEDVASSNGEILKESITGQKKTGGRVHNPEHSAGQSDDIRPPDPEYPATLGMPS